MSGEVRVLVYQSAQDISLVHDAYHHVSKRLMGVPGLVGNELLGSITDPTGFVVLSRWSGMDAFREWEQGPAHRDTTAPLRPYRDQRLPASFGVYQVVADY
ncbi:antibiotic biosynthesis monooxygenase family protein [Amycolatopsis rubida]|uniref:Heme-degrading monooxygenase HmoA n=1 Tax=Amycolatopsis rubida TaxID=112413 RepID=A0A1I5TK60_9PSEU|nr:antibiotic biosynthesis monooxygenase [Amycolatopsis rubida]SFP83358.1 Heme-degrading monooxygenase HmoA [Amycolatopsis rubida]